MDKYNLPKIPRTNNTIPKDFWDKYEIDYITIVYHDGKRLHKDKIKTLIDKKSCNK